MFDRDDYTDNVDCCEYVFNKNEEIGLGLSTTADIQRVANMYADELQEYQIYEFVEIDELLFEVARLYAIKVASEKITDLLYETPDITESTILAPVDDIIHKVEQPSGIETFYDEESTDEEDRPVLEYLRENEGFDDGNAPDDSNILYEEDLPFDTDQLLYDLDELNDVETPSL